MTNRGSSNKRSATLFQRWRHEDDGSTIVEFSLIFPALIVLFIGMVEVSNYFTAKGRVLDAASAVGDIATRFWDVTDNDVLQLMKAGDAVIATNSAAETNIADTEITLTNVLACRCEGAGDSDAANFCFHVVWSHRWTKGELSGGYPYKEQLEWVPQALAIEESESLVITEISYQYSPLIKMTLTEDMFRMNELRFNRPRSNALIAHVGTQSVTPVLSCTEIANGDEEESAPSADAGGETDEAHDEEF